MNYLSEVIGRLWSVGTPLMALGGLVCFGSRRISGRIEKSVGEMKGIGWDNAVKLAGLGIAVLGMLVLFIA